MFHLDEAESATRTAILASSSHVHDKSTYAKIFVVTTRTSGPVGPLVLVFYATLLI